MALSSSSRTAGSGVFARTAFVVLRIRDSGVASVNMDYQWTSSDIIPNGFASVCHQNNWNVQSMWNKLNNGRDWLHAPTNDAYIYYNAADKHWWIDEPNGHGIYIVPVDDDDDDIDDVPSENNNNNSNNNNNNNNDLPPITGWRALSTKYEPLPTIDILSNNNREDL